MLLGDSFRPCALFAAAVVANTMSMSPAKNECPLLCLSTGVVIEDCSSRTLANISQHKFRAL